ncbi:MAG: hypothetical protein HY866_14905 [Chloroflexi bacterium]|nr:hypothetical protein [Chloroflexota bacterium]
MQPGSLNISSELNITTEAILGADLGWHMPVRIARTEGKTVYCDGLYRRASVSFEQSLNNLIRSHGVAEGEV